MVDISKHLKFWEDKDKWYLYRGMQYGYTILGHNERGELGSMIIEDDDVAEAVVNRMLEEGVKVLSEEEYLKMLPQIEIPPGCDLKTFLETLDMDANE